MEYLFSVITTVILIIAVVFAIRIFNKTIQEDIKDFKEKYHLTKKLLSNLKNK